ncbi:MAG: proline dehydrogenase family protein [Fimbriimonadaceae bacterium]
MLSRKIILSTAGFPPVKALVEKSPIFRPMVNRFVAGVTFEQALQHGLALVDQGFSTSLDYLGENTLNEEEALAAKAAYIKMLEGIAAANVRQVGPREPMNISIKLTQCGLDQGEAFCEANFREVLAVAKDLGNFVRVDMESSAYTDRTLDMIERVLPDLPNTGTVLQTMLRRTPDDLDRLIRLGARTRLVKGAYLEPESVAYPAKADVDQAYKVMARRMLAEANFPAFATHDTSMIESVKSAAKELGVGPDRFEFQMLYGIRRDLQDALRNEGYGVRVYIPYGDGWYPYFTRRLAERPANMLFVMKAMFKR